MIHNKDFYVKLGEQEKVIPVWLQESNGRAISLTGWVVKMKVTKKGFSTVLIDVTMTNDPDQTSASTKGKATYALTSSDMALLPKGKYDIEFTATSPTGQIRKFPIDPKEPFGTLHVLQSKG